MLGYILSGSFAYQTLYTSQRMVAFRRIGGNQSFAAPVVESPLPFFIDRCAWCLSDCCTYPQGIENCGVHIAACGRVANTGQMELAALLGVDEWKRPADERFVFDLSKVARARFEVVIEFGHR